MSLPITNNPAMETPAPADLRATIANFATGVAIITTLDQNDAPFGVTVNSFNAVSLSPPLVLWSVALSAFGLPVWRAASGFVVNILAEDQDDLCRIFSSRQEDRFTGLDWQAGVDGLPLLPGAVATLECRFWERYPGGDHEIMLGKVVRCTHNGRVPLVYCQGQLGGLRVA